MHFRLKELHRLVQCSLFSLARDQKELCLLQAGESGRMLSSQIPDEFKLVAHPGGCCPLWGLSPRLLSRSTVREKKAARRRRRSVDEISLLPQMLREQSLSHQEIVLPYQEAKEALDLLRRAQWAVGGEGWVKDLNGSQGFASASG